MQNKREIIAEAKKKEREAMTPEQRQAVALEAIADTLEEIRSVLHGFANRRDLSGNR